MAQPSATSTAEEEQENRLINGGNSNHSQLIFFTGKQSEQRRLSTQLRSPGCASLLCLLPLETRQCNLITYQTFCVALSSSDHTTFSWPPPAAAAAQITAPRPGQSNMVVASKKFVAACVQHCKWLPCPGSVSSSEDGGQQFEELPAVLAGWSEDAKQHVFGVADVQLQMDTGIVQDCKYKQAFVQPHSITDVQVSSQQQAHTAFVPTRGPAHVCLQPTLPPSNSCCTHAPCRLADGWTKRRTKTTLQSAATARAACHWSSCRRRQTCRGQQQQTCRCGAAAA